MWEEPRIGIHESSQGSLFYTTAMAMDAAGGRRRGRARRAWRHLVVAPRPALRTAACGACHTLQTIVDFGSKFERLFDF